MDFNQLLAKMRDLDQPVPEAIGDPMPPMSMPSMSTPPMNDQPPPAHRSMSVNLNAQGMDNIESLLKLMTKVNPDMINQPSGMPAPGPALAPMPSIMPPGPSISSIGDLGNLDSGPLKMLPNLDKEPEGDHAEPDADNMGGPRDMDGDNMPGGMDGVSKAQGDQDNDGDHDMDDHDMEPKDDKEDDEGEDEPASREKKTDEWANEPDPELKSIDYMVNKLSGGLGRQQTMTKHGYQQGDNPLAMRENLRASIKQELAQRLAEAKLAELSKDTLKSYQDKAGKEIVNTMTSGDYMTTDKSAKKVMKRWKGADKAGDKIYKKDNA